MSFDINVEVENKNIFLNLNAVQGDFVFDFKRLTLSKNQVENLHLFFKRYNAKTLKLGENLALFLMTNKGVKVVVDFIYEADFKGNKVLKLYIQNDNIKCAMIVERDEIFEFYQNLSKVNKLFEKKKILGFNNIQLKMLLI